jgi:predicted RNA methylase
MSAGAFVLAVQAELMMKHQHSKTSMEKLAASFHITDKTEVKELTELAIVNRARRIAHSDKPVREQFEEIVELYHTQVNLSHRTSQSILLQQYSTPAPIGYVAGLFCQLHQLGRSGYAFEPSAGNGLLTIVGDPKRIYVNEIDQLRNANLKKQDFAQVWKRDATQPFFDVQNHFPAVLTNPPFGRLDKPVLFDTFKITTLEHLMALRALETMTSDGKAAIIIGGHTRYDPKGRVERGSNRIFLNYLYSRYHVVDILPINGQKLYAKQGTAFDTRLILIDGRKAKPEGAAPVYNSERDAVVRTFDELFSRVVAAIGRCVLHEKQLPGILALEREALDLQDLFGPGGLGAGHASAG